MRSVRRTIAVLAAAAFIVSGLAACDTTPQPDKVLNLPRVAWAGGPGYWAKFPDAVKAGWDKDTFFPVVGWWMYWNTDRSALQYYKDHGINAFIYGNEGDQSFCDLKAVGGVSWIGLTPLKGAECADGVWTGTFLDDETDGQMSEAEGKAHLAQLRDQSRAQHPGKAIFNNFTGSVLNWWNADSFGEGYVNDYQDASSVDIYWATGQGWECSPDNPNWWPYDIMARPADRSHCHDAQSYGKVVDGMRVRDAADGKMQPVSAFVEDGGGEGAPPINPAVQKAAAVSAVIHGAGYLSWFNNSWADNCFSFNVLWDAKSGKSCVQANAAAVKDVNAYVRTLAPWLNKQAYQWTFGPGIESRLSVRGDIAAWIAETDGSTGAKTFTLPPDLAGVDSVGTLDGRTIPVTGGKYVDTFESANEYQTYFTKVPA